MTDLIDLRMHQHIAHEIYRQQMLQRIPDPFPTMLPVPVPPMHAMALPPRYSLPGVELKLQNKELWREFHKIGTEMIITKSGRRMFPSMRLTVDGLDADTNYCVLLEMMPISDCRFKFSGSQWVPAGGAEPQSPQRFCLHPDSPALGTHWASQPIVFNKVKLTNNTLDNNGHVVLTSMHKYQPRIHIIRTSDPSQIPWAAQQAFVFPETEFVAVTAYQNDRITKLKIDNNPFAKGFRETGQSRCKRKMGCNTSTSSSSSSSSSSGPGGSGGAGGNGDGGGPDGGGQLTDDEDRHDLHDLIKRPRSNGSPASDCTVHEGGPPMHHPRLHQPSLRPFPASPELLMRQYNQMFNPSWMDLMLPYFARHHHHHPYHPQPHPHAAQQHQHHHHPPGPFGGHPLGHPSIVPVTGSQIAAPIVSPAHSNPDSTDLDRSSAFSVRTPQTSGSDYEANERISAQPDSPEGSPKPTILRPSAIRPTTGSSPATPTEAPPQLAVVDPSDPNGDADRKINFSIASILLL
ncbi:T-box transcription factor TBX6-like [Anopheles stephensi]|uniref:T-box transcription factor TBX6-like n=1 Tax=Anopheles stephensi TaxID=30069 RepID=UPI00165873EE|nr:T-box transcription factor TBX6-like [Anopheles stephensi]